MERSIGIPSNLPLRMWRDLTPIPFPLQTPSANAQRILVIGGGITGLTTAWTLLDRGYKVTIVSKQWASVVVGDRITSQIAGALWEYPPAVCGQHEGKVSLEESKRWSMISYHCYAAIAEDAELSRTSGIIMRPAKFYFPTKLEDDEVQNDKMKEIMAAGVKGFKRMSKTDLQNECIIAKDQKIEEAYEIDSPIIDSDLSMQWLMKLVQDKGAHLVTKTIVGDLFKQEDQLLAEHKADIIVNATGLGAEELASDASCYPVRGALLRVVNDGRQFPRINEAHTVSADVSGGANEIVFIVPRNDNTLLLGGIAEDRVGDLDLTLDSPKIQGMRARCAEFIPMLENAQLHPSYPLALGLRPFRKGNVRVERELRQQKNSDRNSSRIVHSYGQGGAGWTLAFGCAADVCILVEEVLADTPPRPLKGEVSGNKKAENLSVPRARL